MAILSKIKVGSTTYDVSDKSSHSDLTTASKTYVGGINELNSTKADKSKIKSITLSATWTGSASPYSQTVTISGYTVTANTKVDLQPAAAAIQQLIDDGVLGLYIINNNGTLTAYSIGEKPTASLTIQATLSEVTV